jgi:hypothetical protein
MLIMPGMVQQCLIRNPGDFRRTNRSKPGFTMKLSEESENFFKKLEEEAKVYFEIEIHPEGFVEYRKRDDIESVTLLSAYSYNSLYLLTYKDGTTEKCHMNYHGIKYSVELGNPWATSLLECIEPLHQRWIQSIRENK